MSNKGNFLEILNLVRSENEWLDKRLSSAAKNAKYISPDIQNDLLHAASKTVLEAIKNELHVAKYFAVMVDETRDISKVEQVSVCVRYCIDATVHERFLGFYDTQDVNAASITALIVSALHDHGLNIQDCIAQCYDGAAVMSGKNSGVQKCIRNIVEHCIFVHCHAHRLNLVLVSTARCIQSCEDFFGILQLLHSFFSVSMKRHSKFIEIQQNHQQKTLEIPGLSDTRWACRYQSVHVIRERIECIVETLEYIKRNSTDGQEKAEAGGIISQVTTWTFLFHLIIFSKLLGITSGLSQLLQSETLDIAAAIHLVNAIQLTLKDCRTSSKCQSMFDETNKLASKLKIPSMESR